MMPAQFYHGEQEQLDLMLATAKAIRSVEKLKETGLTSTPPEEVLETILELTSLINRLCEEIAKLRAEQTGEKPDAI